MHRQTCDSSPKKEAAWAGLTSLKQLREFLLYLIQGFCWNEKCQQESVDFRPGMGDASTALI